MNKRPGHLYLLYYDVTVAQQEVERCKNTLAFLTKHFHKAFIASGYYLPISTLRQYSGMQVADIKLVIEHPDGNSSVQELSGAKDTTIRVTPNNGLEVRTGSCVYIVSFSGEAETYYNGELVCRDNRCTGFFDLYKLRQNSIRHRIRNTCAYELISKGDR